MDSRYVLLATLSVTNTQLIDIDDQLPHHSYGREAVRVGGGRSGIVLKVMSP